MKTSFTKYALALAALGASGTAMAHTGHPVDGALSGFVHPFSGADHLVAMLMVGLWAGLSAGRRAWLPIVSFMAFMMVGGLLGVLGIALPNIEAGIAASLLVMGLLLATLARLPAGAGIFVVGLFAVFHGHAHGAEMPAAAAPALYALGFLLATASLHLTGLGLSRLAQRFHSEWLLRGAGIASGGLGAWLLLGM